MHGYVNAVRKVMIQKAMGCLLATLIVFTVSGQTNIEKIERFLLEKQLINRAQWSILQQVEQDLEKEYAKRQPKGKKGVSRTQGQPARTVFLLSNCKESDVDTLCVLMMYHMLTSPGTYVLSPGFSVQGMVIDSTATEEVLKADVKAYLELLRNAGLVSDRCYKVLKSTMNTSKILYKFQLLVELVHQQSQEKIFSAPALTPLLEKLQGLNLLSSDSAAVLHQMILRNEVYDMFPILSKCRNALYFDQLDYKGLPEAYYPAIVRKAGHLLSNSIITDIRAEAKVENADMDSNRRTIQVVLMANADGRQYRSNFRDFPGMGKANVADFLNGKALGGTLLLNKILTDKNAPYRLHNFSPTYPAYYQMTDT
jgi:hypothetical protein